MMKRIFSLMLATAATLGAVAAEEGFSYVPTFHGAVRARYELDARHGDSRFQVRNARLTMEGHVAPSIDYFIQTDLCDQGSMKILDAYGRFRVVRGLSVQAGQFRMPFGVETFRAPQNYIFANRSFMGKQVMNYRAVGAKVAYTLPKTPLTLEFGVFNPATIGNHTGWYRTVAYSGKATWRVGQVALSASYASIKPAATRANLIDGSVVWDDTRHWMIAAEYMHKHYVGGGAKDVDTWMGFVDWHMPVKAGVFNRWSVQARFDGMTAHADMTDLSEVAPKRNRLTVGSTLTYSYKILHADVRVNYERYFYNKGVTAPLHDSDRLVAELVVRF